MKIYNKGFLGVLLFLFANSLSGQNVECPAFVVGGGGNTLRIYVPNSSNTNYPPPEQLELSFDPTGPFDPTSVNGDWWTYSINETVEFDPQTGCLTFSDGSTCSYDNGTSSTDNTHCPTTLDCPVEVLCINTAVRPAPVKEDRTSQTNQSLLLVFDKQTIGPFGNGVEYYFYFGENHPGNGNYPIIYDGEDAQHYYLVALDAGYNCTGIMEPPTFVELSWWVEGEGETCTFGDEGVLPPECSSVMDDCADDLVGYIETSVAAIVDGETCDPWAGACNPDSPIYRTGNLAIGTENHYPGYQLTAKGTIVTERFKVINGGNWCDYVFDEKYDLMPLREVKEYILSKKHLPKFPSETEIISSGGYDLEDITINQQEKIEEMFLHLISLDEKRNQLENILKQ